MTVISFLCFLFWSVCFYQPCYAWACITLRPMPICNLLKQKVEKKKSKATDVCTNILTYDFMFLW